MGSFDNSEYSLDGVPYSQYKNKSKREYELEKHERESCVDIRTRIKSKKYTDSEQVREHLEWLENLVERIGNILNIETKEGISNLSLKRDYSKVKNLYNDLSRVLDGLESF